VDQRSGLQSTTTGRGFDKFYGIWHGTTFPNKPKLMAAAADKPGNPMITDGDRPLRLSGTRRSYPDNQFFGNVVS